MAKQEVDYIGNLRLKVRAGLQNRPLGSLPESLFGMKGWRDVTMFKGRDTNALAFRI